MFVLSSNHYQNYQSPSLQGNIQALSSAVSLYLYMIIAQALLALYINSTVSVSFSEASTNLYTERALFPASTFSGFGHNCMLLSSQLKDEYQEDLTLQVTFSACKPISQIFFCYRSSIYTEMLCSSCR